MSSDNRTVLNDCEQNNGWTGDDAVTVVSNAGEFYEGTSGLSWQASDGDEHMYTTYDSVGAGTFNLDLSDVTMYLLVKDNLGEGYSTGGVQYVIGDSTNVIGYDVGGNDAIGIPLSTYFQSYKLDVSVQVASPESNTAFSGSEASLDQTQITQVGYGANHLAKANGPSDNVFMDCYRYIANGSYALTINGGTSGTPETMADVQGDDVTNGWGMVANPFGSQYVFFAPTEWGEASASDDSYFTASNEQWYWLGDNAGGHAVGTGNFPFRLVSNGTDVQSFVLTNVSIVNIGTGADVDASDTNFDIIEVDGCTIIGWASFQAPTAGGTSRFWTNTTFISCGQIAHNGASMNGCTIEDSTVAADEGSLLYDVNADPDGEMDDMTFIKGSAAHHAIEFGTSAPLTMTLRGLTVTDFNASNEQNDSVLLFPDTGSDVTWTINLVGASGTVSYKKARAGDTVDISAPVTFTLTNLVPGTEIRVIRVSDNVELAGVESSGSTFVYPYNYTGDVDVKVTIQKFDQLWQQPRFTLGSVNQTQKISQQPDLTASNPS